MLLLHLNLLLKNLALLIGLNMIKITGNIANTISISIYEKN